jgi:hypothetical protein
MSAAHAEAHSLYRLVGHDGNTVESIRALIGVPARLESVLRDYIKADPTDAAWVESAMHSRSRVAKEFEALVRQESLKSLDVEKTPLGAD